MGVIFHKKKKYGGAGVKVQSDATATSLNPLDVPNGQTIESVLNSNLMPNAFTGVSPINTSLVTDFGHNSFTAAGVLHIRGFCHLAAMADQTQIFQISGKTAKFRSEGVIIMKQPAAIVAPIYIPADSNTIYLNSAISSSLASYWSFVIIDIALN